MPTTQDLLNQKPWGQGSATGGLVNKCFNNWLLERGKPWLVAFANVPGVNTFNMADFKLLIWYHLNIRLEKDIYSRLWESVCISSSMPLNPLICVLVSPSADSDAQYSLRTTDQDLLNQSLKQQIQWCLYFQIFIRDFNKQPNWKAWTQNTYKLSHLEEPDSDYNTSHSWAWTRLEPSK